MDTSIKIKPSELNKSFLSYLKKIAEKSNSSELTITLKTSDVLRKESSEEYKSRLLVAKENLDKGENTITFSADEFDSLAKKLLKNK